MASRSELIAQCRELGLKGYSTKKKEELEMLIATATGAATTGVARPHLSPLVKWSGGKADEIPQILPYLPASWDTYLEPFIGGGALYFYLNPQKAVINDIHPDLVALYKSIGEPGGRAAIKQFMAEHPNNEATYYQVRDLLSATDLDRAKQFYYLRKTCFRGMLRYNSSGKFNIPYGKYATINVNDLDNAAYEELLAGTTVRHGSFLDIFRDYNSPENFMFLDPPYDSKFTDYGYCSFGRPEHEALAKAFKETQIKCLMVIGKTDYIANLYAGYIVGEYDKKYRFKIHSGRVGDEINTKHLVIRNYS